MVFCLASQNSVHPGASHNNKIPDSERHAFLYQRGPGQFWNGGVGKKTGIYAFRYKCFLREINLEKKFIWVLRVWKLLTVNLSPWAYDMENFMYRRIPCFGNTVWMIQYSNDFLNFGWSFHELPMWPMVLITDKSIGMGFLKMEWTDEKCNLKSKWREFDTQWEKGF